MTSRQFSGLLALLLIVETALAVVFMPSPTPHVAIGAEVLGGLLGIWVVIRHRHGRTSQGPLPEEVTPTGRLVRNLLVVGVTFAVVTAFGTDIVARWSPPAWSVSVGAVPFEGIWLFLISLSLTALAGLLVAANADGSSGPDQTGSV